MQILRKKKVLEGERRNKVLGPTDKTMYEVCKLQKKRKLFYLLLQTVKIYNTEKRVMNMKGYDIILTIYMIHK